MFTGIIEELGCIREIQRGRLSVRLSIRCHKILEDMKIGDSIAVNGICLTVTARGADFFCADVMPETMRRTGLEKLKVGDGVNLERALRLLDRLGGHIVSGHIDGTGRIVERKQEDNAIWLTIEAGEEILRYIVEKGSIALDGASLTVVDTAEGSFRVSLIPLTARATVLGEKKLGDIVNIECDVLGKYVERLIGKERTGQRTGQGISMELLIKQGFV